MSAGLLAVTCAGAMTDAGAALAQGFATDAMTGYAVGGHDPVAYFIDRRPRRGAPDHELRWADTVWVFVNEGNRAAFEKAPEVYAPYFSGCDPYALAQGGVTQGNPMIFALYDGRLLLFHSEINRFLFLADPQVLDRAAQGNARRLGCPLLARR